MNFIIQNESTIRLGFFTGGLLLFWLLGLAKPFRKSGKELRHLRWSSNLILSFGNSFLVKVLAPLSLVQVAEFAIKHNYGVFNLLELSPLLNLILSVIVFDAIIYWQHRISHIVPLLWRLHRVHHTDIEFDVTTASRFHPIEIFASFFVKALFVVLLGASPVAIIVFEVVLNLSAMFNHGNYSLSPTFEKIVRFFIITPDMHRIHHSTIPKELNSNYGFFLSIWDRVFKSYTKDAKEDPLYMPIGLTTFRKPQQQHWIQLLKQPFQKDKS